MPRFFFDLDECGEVTPDEEGVELAGLHAARSRAIASARELMASEIREGRLCLGCAIRIRREGEGEVDVVWFRGAVKIAGENECPAV